MRRWMIAAAVLGTACTAGPDTGDTDTDDTGVVDTSDTGQQQVAQWRDLRIETSTTFNAVYTGGTGAWIAGNGGALYRYERGEGTQVLAPGREDLRGIWGVGDEDPLVFAVGTAGEVLTRQRGSGTVTADDLGTTNFEDVDGLEGDLTAVGWGGVYRLDGEGWSFENTPGAAQINGVRAFPDGTAVAVSNQGTILERGTDGVWARADAVTSRDLHAIAGEANDLWIVGASGIVLHNDGSGWTEIDSGTSLTLWGVWVADNGEVFIVGNNGEARVYDGTPPQPSDTDSGEEPPWFESLFTGVDSNLYAVHGASPTDVWAVGTQGQVLRYRGPVE